MKKVLLVLALAAAALALPAYATAHGHAGEHGKSHKCKPHKVGYVASGTVTAVSLTQTAGDTTPADSSDDRYSGTLSFDVAHANHHAKGAAGNGDYTLTNVKVQFGDGLTAATLAPGDGVKVIGKITAVAKRCSDKSGAGQVTVRQLVFHAPAQPEPAT